MDGSSWDRKLQNLGCRVGIFGHSIGDHSITTIFKLLVRRGSRRSHCSHVPHFHHLIGSIIHTLRNYQTAGLLPHRSLARWSTTIHQVLLSVYSSSAHNMYVANRRRPHIFPLTSSALPLACPATSCVFPLASPASSDALPLASPDISFAEPSACLALRPTVDLMVSDACSAGLGHG